MKQKKTESKEKRVYPFLTSSKERTDLVALAELLKAAAGARVAFIKTPDMELAFHQQEDQRLIEKIEVPSTDALIERLMPRLVTPEAESGEVKNDPLTASERKEADELQKNILLAATTGFGQ